MFSLTMSMLFLEFLGLTVVTEGSEFSKHIRYHNFMRQFTQRTKIVSWTDKTKEYGPARIYYNLSIKFSMNEIILHHFPEVFEVIILVSPVSRKLEKVKLLRHSHCVFLLLLLGKPYCYGIQNISQLLFMVQKYKSDSKEKQFSFSFI